MQTYSGSQNMIEGEYLLKKIATFFDLFLIGEEQNYVGVQDLMEGSSSQIFLSFLTFFLTFPGEEVPYIAASDMIDGLFCILHAFFWMFAFIQVKKCLMLQHKRCLKVKKHNLMQISTA